jgi:hypothetical protein
MESSHSARESYYLMLVGTSSSVILMFKTLEHFSSAEAFEVQQRSRKIVLALKISVLSP